MATLSDQQAARAAALTDAYRQASSRDAAKIAAVVALYYQSRVNVQDSSSVEAWLDLMIPRLIRASDSGATRSAVFFNEIRRLEAAKASDFRATPALGMIDEGVRKSLLNQGPYDYMNKAKRIERLDVSPAQQKSLLLDAKKTTAAKVAASVVRHAQAGGRQTIFESSAKDETALGWVRVTRAKPCAFCAMLASRGLQYRSFKEDSFISSDARFTGDGTAKVHDNCQCGLKAVYSENDPLVERTEKFAEMWTLWGAGGGDAVLRFRRGYDHWARTGEFMTWDRANEGLRAA